MLDEPQQQVLSPRNDDSSFFEGCGREGPIRCIFFSEFHPTAGPKISCQVPEDFISKEVFDAVSVYIIPKQQLQRSILTVNVLGHKITGFPISISNKKYARNAFYFNLCFVCDAWARTVQYEGVVKKLAEYLMMMELESDFLSNELRSSSDNCKLPKILQQILADLNSKKICTITEGTTNMHLKVVKVAADPPAILDHQVPIFTVNEQNFKKEMWDLTTQQVLPLINGFNHVAKIAAEADVESNLVKACVQNLVYYGIVQLIPIFQYSNVYCTTPALQKLSDDAQTQEECVKYVAKSETNFPTIHDVFTMYCNMTYGTTLKDLCIRINPYSLKIDEQKLVQYGLLQGYIRRINKYPVFLGGGHSSELAVTTPLHQQFNGLHSFDEICCTTGLSASQLDQIVDSDPSVFLIWK
ncbi:GATOR complex protein NPRL2 [Neocloeon triangulifer]|uniref:GATOR complex protein NPRL2 n=1 Tax=Neocloeon triangulifer TaxID=2078957 RepID=UPI00286F036C|nr:GATOR complex protein NPRL2 [Neocloeon triangulifer]XP_059489457.1 GATOR complex protein NPRL2 [Neocloeon triangulifer]